MTLLEGKPTTADMVIFVCSNAAHVVKDREERQSVLTVGSLIKRLLRHQLAEGLISQDGYDNILGYIEADT